MKKYVFTVKKATKYGVEIEAENKNEAFKKIMNLATEDDEKNINNADIDKQIYRFKLKEIIEEKDGKIERKEYKRDEDILKIIEELDEDSPSNYRRLI
ncbi:MAG: hypothetical protein IJE05_00585 [Clostridia bacterium]|nr:hypothetical protein [Clostridia bacterium]